MKQLLQNLNNGKIEVIESPNPSLIENHIIVNTNVSLISAGTEKMLLNFGNSNFIDKARQQPEKVIQVLDKAKSDGILSTYEAVQSKLKEPIPLGYSSVGRVLEVGVGAGQFKSGDRVVTNSPHADVVRAPKNLCAKIPDNVSDEEAAFTVLGSIALHGVRLAKPTLGEKFAVIGVGLIGLLTIQILRSSGCSVLAIDFDKERLKLAKIYGASTCDLNQQDPIAFSKDFTNGMGIDGVIIAASTDSNDPITQAAKMSRKQGRIILIGTAGLKINRSDFYEKELTFQVSCSYGPGRYDLEYEKNGMDYPFHYVRWTERRNFEAILEMISLGSLDIKKLISNKFKFEDFNKAYKELKDNKSSLGILLEYDSDFKSRTKENILLKEVNKLDFSPIKPIIGFVGAGNYASRVLIPAFKKNNAQLHTIATSSGLSGAVHGKKMGFLTATSELKNMLTNDEINTIVITTRHNTHASIVLECLKAGKNVFVEKPLALNHSEVREIYNEFYQNSLNKDLHLCVGFNRRFSPHIKKIKELILNMSQPKSFIFTINAGYIPEDHWTQNIKVGGGRILGEVCHFIDLMRFLAGSKISSFECSSMSYDRKSDLRPDSVAITLNFADGSFGTINYLSNGSTKFPKERIEVFTDGKILQLDNFRKLRGYGWNNFKKMNLFSQDKGQLKCVDHFLRSIEQGDEPIINPDEIFEVAKVTIDVDEELSRRE